MSMSPRPSSFPNGVDPTPMMATSRMSPSPLAPDRRRSGGSSLACHTREAETSGRGGGAAVAPEPSPPSAPVHRGPPCHNWRRAGRAAMLGTAGPGDDRMRAWTVDADDIRVAEDFDESLLHRTPEIDGFLNPDRDDKFIVIGTKGFGKTLLLKAKRILYQREGRAACLPTGNLLDKPIGDKIFGR